MKNVSAVVFPSQLKGDILLFKSLYSWLENSLECADIEEIYKSDSEEISYKENVLFISEGSALINSETIKASCEKHIASNSSATIVCSSESDEVYAVWLSKNEIKSSFKSMDDVVSFIKKSKISTDFYYADDDEYVLFINSARDLYLANEAARKAVINRALENGAIIMCDSGIIISPDSIIGSGAVILPNTIIRNCSNIGEKCTIGPNSLIDNSEIGTGSIINASQITDSSVGENTKIGPFTQLRPNSVIGNNVKIGDFVEIKNSTVGDETAVAHLTYVGDSDVGRKVNFGCGTVTVNYDGKNKHRTKIDDYAFIGCNSNLVAPVKIGKNAFTAAGSTVTHDVPDDSLYISREKDEKVIEGWTEKRLGKRRY